MTITTQPQSGDWKYGLFGCCGDVKTCCFVYCCSCLSQKRVAESLGGNGMAMCLLHFCFAPCITFYHRGQLRARDGIDGGLVGDILAVCCCTLCAMVQADRQATD
ncbi:unnamed protein product [Oikopleura dioica]|uniref:Uncharacterized protein n=1 Tax=Oikopleura dioica TaxID=34765 RepID=E4X0J0_OIKDI|nr:unnamed protein product [Oikopleura dioica]